MNKDSTSPQMYKSVNGHIVYMSSVVTVLSQLFSAAL